MELNTKLFPYLPRSAASIIAKNAICGGFASERMFSILANYLRDQDTSSILDAILVFRIIQN